MHNPGITDSHHTLRLGLKRFDDGRTHRLNQALFMAETYSVGGSTSRFYTLDTEGTLTVRSVPVSRDEWGRIRTLTVEGILYDVRAGGERRCRVVRGGGRGVSLFCLRSQVNGHHLRTQATFSTSEHMTARTPALPGIESGSEYLGLTLKQVAQAVKADESTLHRWRSGVPPSPVFLSRLEALDELVDEMRTTFRDIEAARRWLKRPVPGLDGRTPWEVVLEGRAEKLSGMLLALNAGMSV